MTPTAGDHRDVAPGAVHDWRPEDWRPARVLIEVRPALRLEEVIMTRWAWARPPRRDLMRSTPAHYHRLLLSPESGRGRPASSSLNRHSPQQI
jgi:hypothetical protein